MSRSTKQSWLEGPGDLKEDDVEDVPAKGQSVKVRGLPAGYSNEAQRDATERRIWPNGEQTYSVNLAKLEVLQFIHGVIDPVFTEAEAKAISEKYGPAWRKVIDRIDELSAVNKEAVDEANARFQRGGEGTSGDLGVAASNGSAEPDVPARVGAGAGDAGS